MSAHELERRPLVHDQEAATVGEQEEAATAGFVPDLVIVFPRSEAAEPGCRGSGPRKVTKKQIKNIFDHALIERGEGKADADGGLGCQSEGFVDMKDVQDAIIIDVVNYLTLEHCHTLAFNSCDEDDLFLCVSLGDPSQRAQEDVVVTKAAEEAMIMVQTSLDGDLANEKFGIKQTLKMGEEMYLPFDSDVIKSLGTIFESPNLDQACHGRERAPIKQYPAGLAGTEGSILRSVDRTRLLMTKIESFVDLEDLLGLGVISAYYIPHNVVKLEEFRSGKETVDESPHYHKPHDAWANFKFSTILKTLRWKPEDVQPIHEIHNYFGVRMAFYFVWLSFTGRFFTALVPFAVVMAVVYSLVKDEAKPKAIFYLLSALLICIGSTLYVKFWRRCENYYAAVWEISEEVQTNHLPDYRGDEVPDPLNQNRLTRMYPWWKAQAVYILAVIVTIVFVGVVVCLVTLVYYLETVLPFGPTYNKSAVSAIFSLQILIFQLVWNVIAGKLVDFANPRTQHDAKDMAVQFLFPFSFVSTYANIIYHEFYADWGNECLSSNCMTPTRPSLYAVVCPALLMQLVSMLKPYALYRYQLNDEMKQLIQESPENPRVERSFLESQAKRPPFGPAQLNLEMNIMMILFGYFLMFGFIAPGITVVIALAFMIKIRIDAFKLCSVYQRMIPSNSGVSGIGAWNDVLSMLIILGRYSASAITIFNLEFFNLPDVEAWVESLMNQHGDELDDRGKLLQKLVLAFAYKELMDILCDLIGSSIDDVSSETKLMKAKRERVAAKISSKVSKTREEDRREGSKAREEKNRRESIENGIASAHAAADKSRKILQQAKNDALPSEGGSGCDGGFFPDLIICFPRPKPDAQPGCCAPGNTKYTKAEVDSIFDDALVLRDKHKDAKVHNEEQVALYRRCSQIEEKNETTLLEIQTAMLEDMIEFLDNRSCHTMLFWSCDRDELFLCIGLGDPTKPAQQDPCVGHAAKSAFLRVQTTFNKELGDEKLGVLQEVGRFEEMYMTFHFGVIEKLSKALHFTPPQSAESGDQTLIKRYTAEIAGTEGSMLRTLDRVRLLLGIMAGYIDLEDAMGYGILSDYYCPHHSKKLEEFSNGKALVEGESPSYHKPHDPWSTFQLEILLCAPLRWNFQEVQPIQEIRDYYGERVAFYFAWLAFTARAFGAAVPVSMLLQIMYSAVHGAKGNKADPHVLKIEAIVCILCSVLACLAATLYQKFWKRWETYYAALWGMASADVTEVRRADYRGDLKPDPLNENKMTKTYPGWKSMAMYVMVVTITAVFIAIVICTVTLIYWLETILPFNDEKSRESVISALFSIQIVVFQLLWDVISQQLVELANPRTDDEAKDLAVQFLFPFSFVSTYANIAYHAFYKSWSGGPCVKENCMLTMCPMIYQVILPALVMQVVSMLKPYALYRWQLHDELKRMQKNSPNAEIHRSDLEEQAKRPPFRTAKFNLEMNTMLILVGYGVLFGFVAPGITLAIALAFMLKIRIDAFKLCSVYQRVFPSGAAVTGIGEWDVVLTGLINIGRFTACAIPIFNLGYLNLPAEQAELVALDSDPDEGGMRIDGKIALTFILKELIDIVCGFVEHIIDDESSDTKLMKAKRAKMAARLTAKVSTFHRRSRESEVEPAFQEKLRRHSEHLPKKLELRMTDGRADIPKLDSQNKEYWSPGMDVDFAPAFVAKTYFGK